MKQLDPKAVWLFFLSSLLGLLFLFIPFMITFSFVPMDKLYDELDLPNSIVLLIENWFLILSFLALLSYVWSQLTYHFYKYELREDGFRKEHGIIWKKYVTIPYERIQNVDIYRGLLARILGLSDLNIQTAGMSTTVGSYGGGSEGRLPGLSAEAAEKVRDELVKRARGLKNQGL